MTYNWVDLAVALLILVAGVRGMSRGFLREGLAFLGLIAGIAAARQWQGRVADQLTPFIGKGDVTSLIAYLLILLAALVIATMLTVALRKVHKILFLGWLDGGLGFLLGAAQGALLALLLLFAAVKFPVVGSDRIVRESEWGSKLLGTIPALVSYLPSDMETVAKFFDIKK